jgi:predicted transcriptional regulator
VREPLWRNVVGDVLRRERLAQERTLRDVADTARISMPYLSEIERGRKEASSEVLAAAARSLGLGLADLLALAQDELARLARLRSRTMQDVPGSAGSAVSRRELGVGSSVAAVADIRMRAQQASSSIAGSAGAPGRRTELCLAA